MASQTYDADDYEVVDDRDPWVETDPRGDYNRSAAGANAPPYLSERRPYVERGQRWSPQAMIGAVGTAFDQPPLSRMIHDIPPVWSGDHPEGQLEPYIKLLTGWLATTPTFKTQQGMTVLRYATGDLRTVIDELDIETLTAEDSGQRVLEHVSESFRYFNSDYWYFNHDDEVMTFLEDCEIVDCDDEDSSSDSDFGREEESLMLDAFDDDLLFDVCSTKETLPNRAMKMSSPVSFVIEDQQGHREDHITTSSIERQISTQSKHSARTCTNPPDERGKRRSGMPTSSNGFITTSMPPESEAIFMMTQFEAFIGLVVNAGCALVDTGAQHGVVGDSEYAQICERLAEHGLKPRILPTFQADAVGVGGTTKFQLTAEMPCAIQGVNGTLVIHVVKGRLPLLLPCVSVRNSAWF